MDERVKQAADELLSTVREVEMEFKDHRADDDFERMLAELNSVKNKKKASSPEEPAKEPAVEQPAKVKESKPAPEKPVAAEQKPAAEEQPKPKEQSKPKEQPQEQPKDKPDRRKKLPPRPEKTAEQIELENKQKAEAEERERKKKEQAEQRKRNAAVERERKERETKMIEQIAGIWENPALADGGRVSMTIKTEQRKALRITIPPEVRRQAEMDQKPPQTKMPEQSKTDQGSAPVKAVQKPAAKQPSAKAEQKPVPKNVEPVIKPKQLGETAASAAETAEAKTIEMKPISPNAAAKPKLPNPPKAAVAASAAVAVPQAVNLKPSAGAARPAAVKPTAKSPAPAGNAAANRAAAKKAPAKTAAAQAAAKPEISKQAVQTDKLALVNVIVCCAMFFGLGLYLVFCTRASGFIQSENRNLAEKPKLTMTSLLDGSYFTDLTVWYTDTIPGREDLKPLSSQFTKLFGLKFDDVEITGGLTPAVKETLESKPVTTTEVTINTNFTKTESKSATTTKKKKKTETEKLKEVPENLEDGVWMGSVIVSGKGKNVRAMSAFGGTFDMGRRYAEELNRYRESLGSSVNIYTMCVPLSSAYYLPKNFKDKYTSQHDFITNIGNELAGVVNIDVYDTLDMHKGEYIYSRTDHHWQPLGAYYAAQVFANRAQFDFPDLSTYTECRIEDFVGTMYAYSNYNEEIRKNPDTFIYYKPNNTSSLNVTRYDTSFSYPSANMLFHDYGSGVNCYSAILGTDDIIAEIETGVHNNRVLVVIKDSYGNALVPYFTHGFEKIYVTDFRYFDINAIDFIRNVGATDVLFAVSMFSCHTESHINAIGNNRIQAADPVDVIIPEEIPDQPEETPEAEEGYDDYDDQQW